MHEEGQQRIDGVKVGELHVEHGKATSAAASSAPQPRLPNPQSPISNLSSQAVGQVDGTQVKERRQGPAHQVQVVGIAQQGPEGRQQRGDEPEQVDGQRAVGKKVGVERAVGAQRLGQRAGPAQVEGDEIDLALVGVQPVAAVPVQAVEAQGRAGGQDQRQQQRLPGGRPASGAPLSPP